MKRKLMWLPLMMLAVTTVGHAQSRVVEIDLPKAIEVALSENPTIKIANLEIERQTYVRRETIGNHLPSLSATAGYNRPIIKNKMAGNLSFEADNSFTAAASLNVPLYAPAVYRTLKLNKEQMYAAVEAARASKITLVAEVKKAFYNILVAQQSLGVLKQSEATIQQTVDQTELMYKNELSSEYDLITAQVQLSNLKPTIIQTTNSIEVGKRLLTMLMSMPEDVQLTLTGQLDDYKSDIINGVGELSTDVSENSDLKSIEIQENILEQQYKLAKTARLPTLAAYGNFNLVGDDFDVAGMNRIFGDPNAPAVSPQYKYRWQKPLSVGVKLSVPIFSGLKNVNKERQVKNNIEQLQLQKDYLRQSLTVEARSSITNIITAREQMYANEKTVTQAEKAYSIANTRYKAGAGTILELNSAELSMTQARLNYSQSIYDYLSAQADYEKVMGKE